jgi:hypothetical protein
MSSTALLWNWVAVAIVMFLVVNFAYGLWKTRRDTSSSLHWPKVKGEIVTSNVKVPRIHGSDDEADCRFELAYRYEVGTKEHRGSHIHAGPSPAMTRRAAEELAAKYPVGASVDVHYRADKPGTSLLEPKSTGNFFALLVFLVTFSCVALVLIADGIAGKVLLYREGGVPLWAFLGPLACAAIGVGMVYEYLRLRKLLHESVNWPTAPGRISAAEVVEEQETSRDNGHETTSTYYRPDIRFAYTVGGREFHSSRWEWGWTRLYGSEKRPRQVIEKYKPGTPVAVHYDSKDPENAVLEPGNRQGTFVPLVVAFVFGGGAVFMFWLFPQLHH